MLKDFRTTLCIWRQTLRPFLLLLWSHWSYCNRIWQNCPPPAHKVAAWLSSDWHWWAARAQIPPASSTCHLPSTLYHASKWFCCLCRSRKLTARRQQCQQQPEPLVYFFSSSLDPCWLWCFHDMCSNLRCLLLYLVKLIVKANYLYICVTCVLLVFLWGTTKI